MAIERDEQHLGARAIAVGIEIELAVVGVVEEPRIAVGRYRRAARIEIDRAGGEANGEGVEPVSKSVMWSPFSAKSVNKKVSAPAPPVRLSAPKPPISKLPPELPFSVSAWAEPMTLTKLERTSPLHPRPEAARCK